LWQRLLQPIPDDDDPDDTERPDEERPDEAA
jgi:hypothetical protein